MKRTFLLLFSLFSLVSMQAENKVSLTLIPPGKITNKVDLDIRGGIVNESASQQTYQVALYWNKENKDALLYETVVTIPAGKAETVKVVIPTKDRVGKNKVIFKVAFNKEAATYEPEAYDSKLGSVGKVERREVLRTAWWDELSEYAEDEYYDITRIIEVLHDYEKLETGRILFGS